ncbi:PLDc N-terminal domain-containing protein [Demequina sp. SO4-18]|uniref:PLDc N-terminal domain-containing protein n=1 Tax=Demequina sp. SO4-18 TaxID=3401026 RepID=UPI003B5B3808
MLRVLLILLYIGPAVYCVAEVAQHPDKKPHGLRKFVWILIIVLMPIVGAAAWLYLKWATGSGGGTQRREPRAPDDDPEYLSWLRSQARRRRQRGEGDGPL